MPHSAFTPADQTLLDSGTFACYQRLWLTDPDGNWKFAGTLATDAEGPYDTQINAEVSHHVDANTKAFQATLARQIGARFSLSPYRSDSLLNADSGGNYAPFLDVRRYWKVDQVVWPKGPVLPDDSDYVEIAQGVVDEVDIQHPSNAIVLTGRGLEGDLMDALITTDTLYGNDTSPVPSATVLQQYLDDWGPGGYTVVEDDPAGFDLILFNQQKGQNLWPAMCAIADKGGFLIDVRPGATAGTFEVHITKPNLSPTVPDYVIQAYSVTNIPSVKARLEGVRTVVRLTYVDTTSGITTIQVPASLPTGATQRYGVRILDVDLSEDTQVSNSTAANNMANRMLADLQFPAVELDITVTGLWWSTLRDFVQLAPNNIHFDQAQNAGVLALIQRWENGRLQTKLSLKGQPSLRYTTWIDLGNGAGSGTGPTVINLTAAFDIADAALSLPTRITFSGNTNSATRSVRVRVSTDPTFATTVYNTTLTLPYGTTDFTAYAAVTTRGVKYYVEATPYSGPGGGGTVGSPITTTVDVPQVVPLLAGATAAIILGGTTLETSVTGGADCQSVKIEIFSSVSGGGGGSPYIGATYYNLATGATIYQDNTIPYSAGANTFYVEITPYSGPLVSGTPSGVAGTTSKLTTNGGLVSLPTIGQGGASLGQVLTWNGTAWAPATPSTASQWKDPVRAATTAAGTLASSFENGDVVDGVTLVTGDRILIKNQVTGSENGIYTVNATGAPTRATDADTGAKLLSATVMVREGTANADTQWTCTPDTITLGTTPLTWVIPGGGAFPSQSANTVYAGPTSGGSAVPAFRTLVVADIPSLDAAKITTGVFPIARLATGTPDGTKFIRDDGTLATPSVGSVPWHDDLTRTDNGVLDNTLELGVYNTTSGAIAVTVRWSQANAVSTKRWLVPLNFNATGGAWQRVRPEYASFNGSADVDLEVNVGSSNTTLRIRRSALGTAVFNLTTYITVEYFGGSAATFTPSTTASTSTVTTWWGSRFNPANLNQNGATDRQPLQWNNTTLQWEPQNPWQTWRAEVVRTLPSTGNATLELGSWNMPVGRYTVTATWNQANTVCTVSWEMASSWNATSGTWVGLPIFMSSYNGGDRPGLEVKVDGSSTAFRLRRLAGGNQLNSMGITLEVMGLFNNPPTFTPSTTASTSAVTAVYNDRLLPTALASGGASHGYQLVYDTASGTWTPVAPAPQNTQGASYTAVLSDAGKVVEMNNGAANTFTLPLNSSVAYPIGTMIGVCMLGAGVTTIAVTAGGTIRVPSTLSLTMVQYQTLWLRKRGTDEWVLSN